MTHRIETKFVMAVACCALATSAVSDATETPPDAALVIEFNEALLSVAEAEDGFLTLKGVRTAAMMHIAMHDALSAINHRYAPYTDLGDEPDADPVIAAAQAAYLVAADQYPHKDAVFMALLRPLADEELSRAQELGAWLGAGSASVILEKRADDGWDTDAEYRWHPMGPGVYAEFNEHSGTPNGFVFGAGWAKAKGFALTSPDQFRSPPPPEIETAEYTEAFDEVKAVGRFQSMSRTSDQAHLALWWKDFVENSHNRLARELVIKENLDLTEATRLFALLNMSVLDAYVSSFDNKFFYNHWRPYTAIRWAANDGNPDTQAEETWTNLHRHTYAFPSYPSAHGTACAAAMSAFENVFGEDYAFTMHIPVVDIAGPFSGKIEMHPATRSFASFSDAAMECSLSRVYLGIHFRYDSTEGFALGNRVGKNVVENLLAEQ